MAIKGTNVLTLADWAKRIDGEGKVATQDIVELLAQTNDFLPDMMWKEGNLATGHRLVMRTGLPQVFWFIYNKGVPLSKSTTAQADEQTGKMKAWS